MLAKVLTVSDSTSRGERKDTSGPALKKYLEDHEFDVVSYEIISDGVEEVSRKLREMSDNFVGVIITTGGTGFSPRDLTPEASRLVIERDAPGFAEAMRRSSKFGPLSRGICGIVGKTIVINVPGSEKGALESLEAVVEVLPHALNLLSEDQVGH